MCHALELASAAEAQGEVPVGAIIVNAAGEVIAEAANGPIALNDPTAHAEVLALRQAGVASRNYRLPGCTLYVTLEPCAMCAAAMVHARIQRLVYAAADPKSGACGGAIDVLNAPSMNHRIEVDSGILADESAELLKDFFQSRR
ncbi:MAG: tRNA adenosine(34) deaminase TadA [Gammaproteobacteria bacterium]|jgi:tRNA(adenine34) deaminase